MTAPRKAAPRRRRATAPQRVRHLLALDAQNVMLRLEARHEEMVALFSRLRNRSPMLEATESWFPSAGFGELSLLEPSEQAAASDFYQALEALRWYFEYTEDMPGSVQTTASAHLIKLREAHANLEAVVGAPMSRGAPPISTHVVVHPAPAPPAGALPPPGKKR